MPMGVVWFDALGQCQDHFNFNVSACQLNKILWQPSEPDINPSRPLVASIGSVFYEFNVLGSAASHPHAVLEAV